MNIKSTSLRGSFSVEIYRLCMYVWSSTIINIKVRELDFVTRWVDCCMEQTIIQREVGPYRFAIWEHLSSLVFIIQWTLATFLLYWGNPVFAILHLVPSSFPPSFFFYSCPLRIYFSGCRTTGYNTLLITEGFLGGRDLHRYQRGINYSREKTEDRISYLTNSPHTIRST